MTDKSSATGFASHWNEVLSVNGNPIFTQRNAQVRKEFNTFTGGENPYWKTQIAQGRNATTSASGDKWTFDCPTGSFYLRWYETPTPSSIAEDRGSGVLPDGNNPDPKFLGDPSGSYQLADAQARLQFLSKYRSMRTSFQGGTFIGELAETLRMLKSPAKALREGIDDYVRTVKKRASRLPRNSKKQSRQLSETWLEYVYGWRPLISDISDLVNAARNRPERVYEPISTSFSLPVIGERQRLEGGGKLTAFVGWKYWRSCDTNVSVRYKGAIDCSVPIPAANEILGLSWNNFVPTVWELIPYSFLVDYFTNIGDIINGMSIGTVGVAWGVRTERQDSVAKASGFEWNGLRSGGIYKVLNYYVTQPDIVVRRVHFGRAGFDQVGVGLSDFSFRLPGVTSTKWLNIGALARLKSLY